jgi:hypothetical protein
VWLVRRIRHSAKPVLQSVANLGFGTLERFRAKWAPVRVKKTRQNKRLA